MKKIKIFFPFLNIHKISIFSKNQIQLNEKQWLLSFRKTQVLQKYRFSTETNILSDYGRTSIYRIHFQKSDIFKYNKVIIEETNSLFQIFLYISSFMTENI